MDCKSIPDKGFLRGNPNLEPEEAWDGDLGLELWWDRLGPLRDLRFEVAGFRSEIDNAIVWVLVNPSLSEPRNTGKATIRGVEFGGSVRGFGWLQVSANHTHLDAERDDTHTPLPGRARNETAARAEVGPPGAQWRVSVQMLRTSSIPVSESGDTRLPSRTVWDASLWVDLMRWPALASRLPLQRLLVSFEARNFTDRAIRDALFFPQPPRMFFAGVEAAF